MDYLPLAVDLRQREVLVVGGGQVALRKVQLLLRAGAVVRLVAPDIHPQLQDMASETSQLCIESRVFTATDLQSKRLVVVATANATLNHEISVLAEQAGILVNVVDQPERSNVIFPALVDRSPLLIAISSSGSAPVLVRYVRAQLESLFPAAYGHLATMAGKWRHRVRQQLSSVTERRRFWEQMLSGQFAELVFQNRPKEAEQWIEQALTRQAMPKGEVYLVGAGPGDPDLLTFKALRLMQQADVIVYDRLVAPEIMERCRRDAERIYVGKERKEHTLAQPEINQLLVKLALQGKRVCRLKGGDPFIFGRGGEEIEHLAQHHIAFQVVPGISAGNGCAAYAGIPLTHRDYAQSVRFVTGHVREGGQVLPWQELVHEQQTLVIYMSLTGLAEICQRLQEYGMRQSMPVALIARGTYPDQQVITGTLVTIVERVAAANLHAPTLTIVGEVVSLRERLQWFA